MYTVFFFVNYIKFSFIAVGERARKSFFFSFPFYGSCCLVLLDFFEKMSLLIGIFSAEMQGNSFYGLNNVFFSTKTARQSIYLEFF